MLIKWDTDNPKFAPVDVLDIFSSVSAFVKLLLSLLTSDYVIPIPVSDIVTLYIFLYLYYVFTLILICPDTVYFIAFPTKLINTYLILFGSEYIISGILLSIS